MVGMKPICTMECEDCGKFLVADPNFISVFVETVLKNGEVQDEAYAVTRCAHCDRVVFQDVPIELIDELINKEVKVFNWNTGSQYEHSNS